MNPSLGESKYQYYFGGDYSGNYKEYLSKIFSESDQNSPAVSFSYGESTWGNIRKVVSGVSLGGSATSFIYPNASGYCPGVPETKLTDQDGKITRIRFVVALDGEPDGVMWCSGKAVIEEQDPLGSVTQYRYMNSFEVYPLWGGRNQLTKVTKPEGNYFYNALDGRANVISSVNVPKGGSGLGNISISRSFPQCNATNFRICNRPDYEIDARGGRTDYIWSDTHGGPLSISRPADSGGMRPETTYQYVSFTGSDGATFYLPSVQIEKITASRSKVTTFEYNPAIGYRLKGKVVTADGQTTRTCYAYDSRGHRISETLPLANLTNCP
jgi:YD repeat-containing protein